jgi:hypothetical protein
MYTTAASPNPHRAVRPTPDQAKVNPWLVWRNTEPAEPQILSIAELAECRCPDLCDRDHFYE